MSNDPYECRDLPGLLQVLESGRFAQDTADDYKALITKMESAAEEGGPKLKVKGKIVLTIDLELFDRAYTITAAAKITPPKRPAGRTNMFSTSANTLSRQHPLQMDAFLRDVDAPSDIRKV